MSPFPDPFRFPRPVVVRLYLRIADLWKLTDAQAAVLAGTDTYNLDDWRSGDFIDITTDMHRRMAYLIGISGALATLFGDTPQADGWIKRPNQAALFEGASALDFMLGGDVERIVKVHSYLYAEMWGNVGG